MDSGDIGRVEWLGKGFRMRAMGASDRGRQEEPSAADRRRAAPREHGAWGMLLVPFAVGVGAAWPPNGQTALLLVCAVSLFLLRAHLAAEVRGRRSGRGGLPHLSRLLVRDSLLGIGSGLVLTLYFGRLWLIPLGVLAGLLLLADQVLLRRRQERSLAGEMLGAAALCLAAPAAYHVGGGDRSGMAAALWLLCALYFWGAVLTVRMRIARRPAQRPAADLGWRLRQGAPVLAAYAAGFLGLAGATAAGWLPALVPAAFVPAVLRAFYAAFRCDGRFDVRRLGWAEVGHSLLFAGLLILALASRAGS